MVVGKKRPGDLVTHKYRQGFVLSLFLLSSSGGIAIVFRLCFPFDFFSTCVYVFFSLSLSPPCWRVDETKELRGWPSVCCCCSCPAALEGYFSRPAPGCDSAPWFAHASFPLTPKTYCSLINLWQQLSVSYFSLSILSSHFFFFQQQTRLFPSVSFSDTSSNSQWKIKRSSSPQ